MSRIEIVPVNTRRERRDFLELPWKLYRGDANWIPPLRQNQKELVGYARHPFYRKNQVQTFLAYRDHEPCGRVAAILNQGHVDRYRERRGFFGFFESIDDQEVANGLFDAVRNWFAQREMPLLRGPTNPSLNYEVGLLVEGFDSPPTFMMTYNPPFYGRLIENYGFHKAQDLYAYSGHIEELPAIRAKLGHVAEQLAEHHGVELRSLDRKNFLKEVQEFLDIYNRSLVNTWGFVPMDDAEVRHLAGSLRWLIVPELTVAARVNGRAVGAVFGLLDYNPRIRQIDGRLFPLGFLRLLWNRHQVKKMRLISTNVIPEYQRMGLGLVLMHALAPHAVQWGIEEGEFSWVLESNSLSRGSLEKGGATRSKTYRIYDFDP
jgi:GNAT superfamily N-acetyltransferase